MPPGALHPMPSHTVLDGGVPYFILRATKCTRAHIIICLFVIIRAHMENDLINVYVPTRINYIRERLIFYLHVINARVLVFIYVIGPCVRTVNMKAISAHQQIQFTPSGRKLTSSVHTRVPCTCALVVS